MVQLKMSQDTKRWAIEYFDNEGDLVIENINASIESMKEFLDKLSVEAKAYCLDPDFTIGESSCILSDGYNPEKC